MGSGSLVVMTMMMMADSLLTPRDVQRCLSLMRQQKEPRRGLALSVTHVRTRLQGCVSVLSVAQTT